MDDFRGPRTLATIKAVLDFAIQRELEARDLYLRYAARTDRQGLRALLVTMADQEKWHEQSLRELRSRESLEPLFQKPHAIDLKISEYTADVEFDPEMSYQDFLLLVVKKEEKSFALYLWLEARSEDEELRLLFKGLAEEEKRHKSLAQDRYDLEILTEN
jgi:rubrerythrin